MAFDWATQGALYTGNLSIKGSNGLGRVGGNAPASRRIDTNNASIIYVDLGAMPRQIGETVTARETAVDAAASGTGTANAYVLPWEAGFAARTKLAQAQSMFITPNLNGCAVFIGGPLTGPTVIHANCQPDLINEGMPQYTPRMDPLIYGARLDAFGNSWRLPIWSDIYVTIASQLLALGLLPDENMGMLLPRDYLGDAGSASVFGARGGGGWAFHVNANRRTRCFWPPA